MSNHPIGSAEAGRRLGVNRSTLSRWVSAGLLEAHPIGHVLAFDSELVDYVAALARAAQGGADPAPATHAGRPVRGSHTWHVAQILQGLRTTR